MRRADTVTLLVSSGSQIHEESADRAFTKTKSIINGTGQENLLSPSPSSTARFQAFSKEQGGRQQIDRQGAAGSEGDIGSDSEQGFLDVLGGWTNLPEHFAVMVVDTTDPDGSIRFTAMSAHLALLCLLLHKSRQTHFGKQ